MDTADNSGKGHDLLLPGYTLLEEAGSGGSARVYKALQHDTGKVVAIKIPHREEQADPLLKAALYKRFEQEIQIGGTLDHPHIARLLHSGTMAGGIPFSVSEYIPGTTLKLWILQHRGLPVSTAFGLMEQVLEALLHAHGKGIVHCDLKPQNIMVTDVGPALYAKVLDFGAGIFTAGTTALSVAGTCRYMPPEQLQGAPPGFGSDLYAWGLILFECLTGKPAIRSNVFSEQESGPGILLPGVPPAHPLHTLLCTVLHPDPLQRMAGAALLYEAFNSIDPGTLPYKLPYTAAASFTDDDTLTMIRISG